MKYALLLFFWGCSVVSAQITTSITSDAAGSEGVFVQITLPAKARYGTIAPVVIHFLGGTSAGDLAFGVNMALYGFIELRFLYPGGTDIIGGNTVRSGGVYDTRGPNSLIAVRDIIQFAQGTLADKAGKKLADYTGAIKPISTNVGLHGSSNGGNTTLTVAGLYGKTISSLGWIVNWESPVGDGAANVEAGGKTTGLNPAYNTNNNSYDYSKLRWNDTLTAGIVTSGTKPPVITTLRGNMYYDINGNTLYDSGDFKLSPRVDTVGGVTRVYYSNGVLDTAYKKNLFPASKPTFIPTLTENVEYWLWRNGEYWFNSAIQFIPNLMFCIVASVEDHVQIAPNYPHVLLQYNSMKTAKSRFVRLNPDRAYVEHIVGSAFPTAADNDAFAAFTYSTVITGLEPRGAGVGGLKSDQSLAAAMCELADRTQTNNLQTNLNAVIMVPTAVQNHGVTTQTGGLHPNPVEKFFFIHLPSPVEDLLSVKISDVSGKQWVFRDYEVIRQNNTTVHCVIPDGLLPKGTYYVTLNHKFGSKTYSFVKE